MSALTDCGHRRRNSDYGISPRLALASQALQLVQEEIVASGCFRILVACDDDRRYDGG
jgi:hypothetical protein